MMSINRIIRALSHRLLNLKFERPRLFDNSRRTEFVSQK